MRKLLLQVLLLHLTVSSLVHSAQAAILAKAEVEQAEIAVLQEDSAVFQSIGMGIALSLAQCDGVELCSLNVNVREMEELIKALETRIDTLTLKQEDVENPTDFQQVLATYVNTRDNYNTHLDKLRELESELDSGDGFLDDSGELTEPDFPVESARDAELLDYIDDLELFEEEPLEDDDTEWDLPPLPGELNDTEATP